MIPQLVSVVKPFLRNFLIFFRLSLGLASGVLFPLVSLIIADISQIARGNIAQIASLEIW